MNHTKVLCHSLNKRPNIKETFFSAQNKALTVLGPECAPREVLQLTRSFVGISLFVMLSNVSGKLALCVMMRRMNVYFKEFPYSHNANFKIIFERASSTF